MTKDEMSTRIAAMLAKLDRMPKRLSGITKATVPIILGASLSGCPVYGLPAPRIATK